MAKIVRARLMSPGILAARTSGWLKLAVARKHAVAANAVVCPSAPEMSTRSLIWACSAGVPPSAVECLTEPFALHKQAGVARLSGRRDAGATKPPVDSCSLVEYSRRHAEFCAYRTAGHAGV